MIKLDRLTLFVIIFYLLMSIFLSWPLLFHLNGFLLSEGYANISHSDTQDHIDYMLDSKKLFLENEDFIIVKSDYAMAQSYVLSGIFFTVFLGLNEVIFHNLFFLVCLFLSGLFMYFFMFELCKDKTTSILSGFLYMSSNFLLHQYVWGHTNNMQLQWIPLVFLFLEKSINYKNIKYGIFLGISLSIQILSSLQYTVYLSILIPFYILFKIIFVNKKMIINKYFWYNILISIVLSILLTSFYLIKRLSIPGPIRTIQENVWFWSSVHSFSQFFDINYNIYLGLFQSLLVLVGVFILFSNIKDKNYKKFIPFVIIFTFLIICIFGPFSYFAPYYWLYKIWPFISNFRVPKRLFPFILMCSSILSSLLLFYIKENKKLKKYRIHILTIIIIIIIFFQILPSPLLSNHFIFYP